jgi:hypothetical protein
LNGFVTVFFIHGVCSGKTTLVCKGKEMKNVLLSLLTHRLLIVRFMAGLTIGLALLFTFWGFSQAWLPEGFFFILPGMAFSPSNCEMESLPETLKVFGWNLALTGGLTIFESMFATGRFPMDYVVPWLRFATYGGMLGTDSFLCANPLTSPGVDISILRTRTGFGEITAYLLIPASLANVYLWRQLSFWHTRIERVRYWKEIQFSWEMILGLIAAGIL